jgi:hypothetical protein
VTATARRALAATTLVAALAVTVGSAAGAAPRWQPVPGISADDRVVVWASGRAWFMNNGTAASDRFATKSARIAGGRLTGWVTTSRAGMRGWTNLGLERDELVFATSTPRPGSPAPFRSIRLLPNGKLGAPEEIRGAAPAAYSSAVAVIRLPDHRLVYGVDACRYRPSGSCGNERVPHLGLCCSVSGAAMDYAALAPPATAPSSVTGLDRQGRIWLAWTQARGNKPPQVVQIDPATLEPRGAPSAAPGSLLAAKIVDLACSETCRLVLTGATRGTRDTSFTWAPGERSLTPIRVPGARAIVVAARPGPGRLDLAFNFTPRASDGRALGVGRGDARGARVRLGSSIAIPQTLGPFERGIQLTLEPMGSFGPGGFVASAVWENFGTGRAHVQAAVLSLR